jgi:hypothetical protein
MKVFICWSGERSRLVAEFLNDWLKVVIQGLKPFMSTQEIKVGKRWLLEIAGQLLETKFGILCLTAENLDSTWLNFEAGALSKTIDDKTFVCPYLIGGLQSAEVQVPLGEFQSVPANKEGTFKLLKTINSALADKQLEEKVLNNAFEKNWPDLKKVLQTLPPVKGEEKPKRKVDDMVEEILDTVRGLVFVMQKREEITPSFFPESSARRASKTPISDFWQEIEKTVSQLAEKTMLEEIEKIMAKKKGEKKRAEKQELKKKAKMP